MQDAQRLAAAQTVPFAGDVDANLRQHLQLVKVAVGARVTLLLFPELSLTGYELARGPALAFEPDDARLRPLVAAAHAHDVMLVVGTPLRASTGLLHIAAFVIEPRGEVHVYTKQHLGAFRPEDAADGVVPPREDAFFSPGTLNPRVTWRGHALALSICADSAHPAHAQLAAERGAELYLSSQFSIAAHMAFKMSRLKEAARRHGLRVVFANYGGPTGGLAAAGGSCVRTSDGEAVVRLPERGCGLAIASYDGRSWTGETVLLDATSSSQANASSARIEPPHTTLAAPAESTSPRGMTAAAAGPTGPRGVG